MRIQFYFFSFIMSLGLVSCSKKVETAPSSEVVKKTLTRNPLKFKKQNENCVTSFSIDEEIQLSIYRFTNGRAKYKEFNFLNQITNNHIKSSGEMPISKSIYGMESFYVMDLIYDEASEKYKYYVDSYVDEITEDGSPLDICPSEKIYDKWSFENAGLNVSQNVTSTYKALIAADPELELEPITLNIGPIKKRDVTISGGPKDGENQFLYETDNASYNGKTNEITFLPQSREYREAIGGAGFWEAPMVASHEYGHHVFSSLVQIANQTGETEISNCFQTQANSVHQYQATGTTHDNTEKFAISSINEGFSDLIAFYSLKKSERSVEGVFCFEGVREVSILNFGKNAKKVFTKIGLDTMNSTEKIKADLDCTTPDFQEVHDVGAIFAYNINLLLSKVTGDKSEKLKILLIWAKSLGEYFSEDTHMKAGQFLFEAIELAYKVALDNKDKEITSNHCIEMNKIFLGEHEYECKLLK